MGRNPLTAAFVGVGLLLGAASARADVTLLFWPGPESEAMQKVVDAFNAGPGKQGGFAVHQLLFSRQGYFDKEISDLAAGSKEFDLALVTTYTLGRYAPFLAPIDSYVGADAQGRFAPVALDSLKADGKLYGVPTDISLHFTYYRKDLIDELLKNPDWQKAYTALAQSKLGKPLAAMAPADWTWDDYVATALFFTQSLNAQSPTRYGTVLELKNLIFNVMLWQATLVSYGGNWLDEAGKPIFDSEAAAKGLAVYDSIVKNGATPRGSSNYEFAEANQAFGTGQAATMLQWNAAYAIVDNKEQMPVTAGKVGIAPMPAGPAGHKTHVHSLGIGLNKASTNKEQAGQFLGFLASEPAMTLYAKAGGTPPMPAVLDALGAERPDLALVGKYAAAYGFVIRGGTGAQAMPIYEALAQDLSAAWAGQKAIPETLRDAQSDMVKALKP
jgi:multiple sugar transport system substrate-binding protein